MEMHHTLICGGNCSVCRAPFVFAERLGEKATEFGSVIAERIPRGGFVKVHCNREVLAIRNHHCSNCTTLFLQPIIWHDDKFSISYLDKRPSVRSLVLREMSVLARESLNAAQQDEAKKSVLEMTVLILHISVILGDTSTFLDIFGQCLQTLPLCTAAELLKFSIQQLNVEVAKTLINFISSACGSISKWPNFDPVKTCCLGYRRLNRTKASRQGNVSQLTEIWDYLFSKTNYDEGTLANLCQLYFTDIAAVSHPSFRVLVRAAAASVAQHSVHSDENPLSISLRTLLKSKPNDHMLYPLVFLLRAGCRCDFWVIAKVVNRFLMFSRWTPEAATFEWAIFGRQLGLADLFLEMCAKSHPPVSILCRSKLFFATLRSCMPRSLKSQTRRAILRALPFGFDPREHAIKQSLQISFELKDYLRFKDLVVKHG